MKPNLRRLGGCKPKPAETRFHASYTKHANGCWLWLGRPQGSNGYGRIKCDGESVQAHRYSWWLHRGPVPDGMLVLHKCDTPLCVNPEHLFLGTYQDNSADCVAKGRARGGTLTPQRGASNPRSKLTDDAVLAIRGDTRSQRQIAAAHGISQALVSKIKRREMWSHL